jgi:hypothetical protein
MNRPKPWPDDGLCFGNTPFYRALPAKQILVQKINSTVYQDCGVRVRVVELEGILWGVGVSKNVLTPTPTSILNVS